MSRIKLQVPDNFHFTASIPVRISDINYGGHLGNDTVLSIIHEARLQFLSQWNFSELNFGGVGMIMADAGIEFKSEAFYGQTILASVAAVQVSKLSFDLYYKLERDEGDKRTVVAIAKTGMVCYNYDLKKVSAIPEGALTIFE